MESSQKGLGIGARVEHPKFGEGIVVGLDQSTVEVFFKSEGDRSIDRSYEGLEIIESPAEVDSVLDIDTVLDSIRKVIQEFIDKPEPIEMAGKWDGGSLVIKPGDDELQSKEIPIDSFFHKIVMVRDRLRVLEQNINSHDKLTDADKVHLQQYISRIYGSLTTFNVLFAKKDDHFSSKG